LKNVEYSRLFVKLFGTCFLYQKEPINLKNPLINKWVKGGIMGLSGENFYRLGIN